MRPKCLGGASVRYGSIALCASCDERRSLVGEGLAGVKLAVPRAPLEVVRAAQALFVTEGESVRLADALAGKGVVPLA